MGYYGRWKEMNIVHMWGHARCKFIVIPPHIESTAFLKKMVRKYNKLIAQKKKITNTHCEKYKNLLQGLWSTYQQIQKALHYRYDHLVLIQF